MYPAGYPKRQAMLDAEALFLRGTIGQDEFLAQWIPECERAIREEGIRGVNASMALENMVVPPDLEALQRRYIDGEITLDDYIRFGRDSALREVSAGGM